MAPSNGQTEIVPTVRYYAGMLSLCFLNQNLSSITPLISYETSLKTLYRSTHHHLLLISYWFCEPACWNYEEFTYDCGGYHNFMHLKSTGKLFIPFLSIQQWPKYPNLFVFFFRELLWHLFGRYKGRHSRSKSRNRSPYRHIEAMKDRGMEVIIILEDIYSPNFRSPKSHLINCQNHEISEGGLINNLISSQ